MSESSKSLIFMKPVSLVPLHLQALSRNCLLTVLILLLLERKALADTTRGLVANVRTRRYLTVVVWRVSVTCIEHLGKTTIFWCDSLA